MKRSYVKRAALFLFLTALVTLTNSDRTIASALPLKKEWRGNTVALQTNANDAFVSDARKVTLEQRADGTRLYHFNDQGAQSMEVRRSSNGTFSFRCGDRFLPTTAHDGD